MAARQSRQRPRSAIHPSTGTLSRDRIVAPQAGQCDLPKTTVSPRGARCATTLRKLPAMHPATKPPATVAAAAAGAAVHAVKSGTFIGIGTGNLWDRGGYSCRVARTESPARARMNSPHVSDRAPARRRIPGWAGAVLRLAATLGLLAWALRDVQWSRMIELLRDADWRWLLAALALGLVVQIVAGMRWAALARPLGFDAPPAYFVWRFFEGGFFSLCLPSSIGGDVVKAYRVGDTTQRRLLAGCSVLADRLTGVAALGVLAGAALAATKWRLSLPATLSVAAGLLLAVLVGFRLVFGSLDRVMNLMPVPHAAREFIAQLLPYQQRPSLIARAVGWSFVVQIGGTLSVALVARTVGVDPGLGAWFAVAPLVALIETVPISIGGFGVRENAMEYLLSGYGVPGEQGIAVALLCGLTRIASGLVGGVLFLLDRKPAGTSDAAVTTG